MIVRLNKAALTNASQEPGKAIGVEGDPTSHPDKISESEKIINDAKKKVKDGGGTAVGVSGSNSGKGHDLPDPEAETDMLVGSEGDAQAFKSMEKVDEEQPTAVGAEGMVTEVDPKAAEKAGEEVREKLHLPEGVPGAEEVSTK